MSEMTNKLDVIEGGGCAPPIYADAQAIRKGVEALQRPPRRMKEPRKAWFRARVAKLEAENAELKALVSFAQSALEHAEVRIAELSKPAWQRALEGWGLRTP